MVEIWHNPRCGKSRETLKIVQDKNEGVTIVEYLKDIPSVEQIKQVLKLLEISAHELIRRNESVYKESYKGKDLTEEQWIQAMADNPILIERPIVINGKRARIGRPPESVKEIL